jgi:hypothetical protein
MIGNVVKFTRYDDSKHSRYHHSSSIDYDERLHVGIILDSFNLENRVDKDFIRSYWVQFEDRYQTTQRVIIKQFQIKEILLYSYGTSLLTLAQIQEKIKNNANGNQRH